MVIHQFNKLIRNKWVWGAFAVLVSAAFCFDDLFSTREREERSAGDAGLLAGERVDAKQFLSIADEIRGFGQQRDNVRKQHEVNRMAWENYAALQVAAAGGLEATDAEVREAIRRDPSFQANGAFSFALYQSLLRQNSLTPERFEEFLKRRLTMARIGQSVLGAAVWSSPMEFDRAVADRTDVLTVKVVPFAQDAKAAAAVKLDDAGLRKWYDANTNSLALPERVKIRFVRFDATDEKVLAKMSVTEDELRDRYDVTVDRYTTTDTNGVEKVKKFEEVKAEIEREVRRLAAVQFFETNVNSRAYDQKAKAGASRLDEIAKEDGLKVVTSDWFATDGSYSEGFMRRIGQICPGAQGFAEAVAELDPESEDLRYAVVSSESAVWLIEKAATSPKHLPTFEEAKTAIRPRALAAAKADAFKAEVEAIAAKGAKAVMAVKGCSTNLTFSVADLQPGALGVDGEQVVVQAAMGLKKGEVSKFSLTGRGKAVLVVCQDRQPGDVAKAMVMRTQLKSELEMPQHYQLAEGWQKWNLDRLGFEAGEVSSVEAVEEME